MPGEFELIRRMTAALPAGDGVVLGIGDDAAVLRPSEGFDLVVTTDSFVEGRHWRAGAIDAAALGRRLAAANLSDLAAMRARPRWAVLAVGAPPAPDAAWLEAVERAFAQALAADGAVVVGGNLSATDGAAWWTVTLLGEVERGGAWKRSGARAGDVLAVTGWPGRAAAFHALQAAGLDVPEPLRAAYEAPESRVRAARAMAEAGGVRAAIDISDGFVGDLRHLGEAGGVGAQVEMHRWPDDALQSEAARRLARGGEAAALAAHAAFRTSPSDDYELLLAVDPAQWRAVEAMAASANCPLTAVGQFVEDPHTFETIAPDGTSHPLVGESWDHFER